MGFKKKQKKHNSIIFSHLDPSLGHYRILGRLGLSGLKFFNPKPSQIAPNCIL